MCIRDRLHGGGVVPALDLDEAGLFDCLLIIALADIGVLQDIPREIFVDACLLYTSRCV